MSVSTRPALAAAAALLSAVCAAPALSAEYVRVASLAELFGETPVQGDRIGGVASLDGTLTVLLDGTPNNNRGRIVRGPDFGTITTNPQIVLAGGSASGLNANALAVSGGNFLFADRLGAGVFSLNPTSGALTQTLTAGQVQAVSGGTRSGPFGQTGLPGGGLVWYDSSADALLRSSGAPGNVSVLANSAALTGSAIGDDTLNYLAAAGDALFVGDNNSDAIYSLAYDAADPASTAAAALSTGDITAVTGAAGAGFNAMTLGDDGRIYFVETSSDSILSFDPAAPAASLSTALSNADLLAGPAGADNVTSLFFNDGQLGFYILAGDAAGIYAVVPEPAALATLLVPASLMGLRRRRQG